MERQLLSRTSAFAVLAKAKPSSIHFEEPRCVRMLLQCWPKLSPSRMYLQKSQGIYTSAFAVLAKAKPRPGILQDVKIYVCFCCLGQS